MSSKTSKSDRNQGADKSAEKAARLAEALRENLHRRKQQARARKEQAPDTQPTDPKDEA